MNDKYAKLRDMAKECAHTARLFDVSEILSMLADLDAARAEIERLRKLLVKAYDSGHRQGWEDGPSVDEVMSEISDYLLEKRLQK